MANPAYDHDNLYSDKPRTTRTSYWTMLLLLGNALTLSCSQIDDGAQKEALAEDHADPPDLHNWVVETGLGPIRGIEYDNSLAFLGIPYAAPPTGDLRFARPEPLPRWDEELQATEYGLPCPQFGREEISEDCLTLNIWTPRLNDGGAPVMVWIHGGGMRTGSSDNPFSKGRYIAESTGTVVVSINYRIGPFGFFAHPALLESGNFGLWDQRAALLWVQDHIADFGGDPSNVTLMGESAGSASTCIQMTSPLNEGLFHKAIMQSGPCASVGPDGNAPVVTLTQAEAQGNELARVLGCESAHDPIQCLRSKSVEEILNGLPLVPGGIVEGQGVNWFPAIDGELIVDQPITRIEEGKFRPIPTLIGTTADEGTVFVADADLIWMNGKDYIARVRSRFGNLADQVLEEYPPFAWGLPFHALSKLLGEMVFVCPSRQTARALSAAGVPTYLYSFNVAPSYASIMAFFGAFHSAEIPFVFHSLHESMEFTSSEEVLSQAMVSYWTSFAHHGNPNTADSVQWPLYDVAQDEHLAFRVQSVDIERNLEKDNCDFWDSVWP